MPGPPWLILPTFNEAENLEAVVAAARRVLTDAAPGGFRVLIVDDDSPDGTGRLADAPRGGATPARSRCCIAGCARASGPRISPASRRALEAGAGYVFEMDADLSHDPADLARLLAAVRDGDADVALGSRYVPGGGVRRLGARAARRQPRRLVVCAAAPSASGSAT